MSKHSQQRSNTGYIDRQQRTQIEVLFDPSKDPTQLLDELAEQQAEMMPSGRDRISKSQLRRVFGELKDIYNRFGSVTATTSNEETEKIYQERFAAPFKMLRSKVAYATRSGGQSKMPADYGKLFQDGIRKVTNAKEFKLYVLHTEAVVGFLYGKDKVGS